MRGLIKRPLKDNEGMIFPHKKMFFPIHTWFMSYPITLLYLNDDFEIIEIKECIQPFKNYHPKQKSNYLIELKHNPNEKYNLGDTVTLHFCDHPAQNEKEEIIQ